jgi:hypothetical protein
MDADGSLFVWGSFKDSVSTWQRRPVTQFYRTITIAAVLKYLSSSLWAMEV